MSRILLIQSRTDPARLQRERDNFARVIGGAAQLEALSALDQRLAWTTPDEFLKYYDGVILGGSSEFDIHGGRKESDPARLMAMIILSRAKLIMKYAFAENKPVLGVCFGHQLIAEMHGGRVENDTVQSKFGTYDVELTEQGAADEVFVSLPKRFSAQYQHKDSVTNLPSGATILACSPTCRFSALKYGDTTYTVQFHPEVRCSSLSCTKAHDPLESSTVVPRWLQKIQVTA